MKKTIKAEIKSSVSKALTEVMRQLHIAKPSRKTRKAIARAEKALRSDVKSAMKKEIKKATKPDRSKELGAMA
jgi:hypothetical protein